MKIFARFIDPNPLPVVIYKENEPKLLFSLVHKDLIKLSQIKDNLIISKEMKELIENEVNEIKRF